MNQPRELQPAESPTLRIMKVLGDPQRFALRERTWPRVCCLPAAGSHAAVSPQPARIKNPLGLSAQGGTPLD